MQCNGTFKAQIQGAKGRTICFEERIVRWKQAGAKTVRTWGDPLLVRTGVQAISERLAYVFDLAFVARFGGGGLIGVAHRND